MSSITPSLDQYNNKPWTTIIQENSSLPSGYSHLKYIAYKVTLHLNHILSRLNAFLVTLSNTFSISYKSRWAWWNPIITVSDQNKNATLYLGALPLKQTFFGKTFRNDAETLKKLNIGAVLSVTEPFENTSEGFFLSAITPDDWKQRNILHLQLSTPDFGTIARDKIDLGVAFIQWNMQAGRSVYVHCKAGRGRSALIEHCYLMKHHSMNAEDALKTLQDKRPQVGLEKAKWVTAKEYEKGCGKPS